jgi:hypothetical protein
MQVTRTHMWLFPLSDPALPFAALLHSPCRLAGHSPALAPVPSRNTAASTPGSVEASNSRLGVGNGLLLECAQELQTFAESAQVELVPPASRTSARLAFLPAASGTGFRWRGSRRRPGRGCWAWGPPTPQTDCGPRGRFHLQVGEASQDQGRPSPEGRAGSSSQASWHRRRFCLIAWGGRQLGRMLGASLGLSIVVSFDRAGRTCNHHCAAPSRRDFPLVRCPVACQASRGS